MSKESDKKSAPMDTAIVENKNPVAATNRQRPCYAIKTLVAEVQALFPETSYEVSNYDGRNTGLDVMFDMTSIPEDVADGAGLLISMVDSDPRVELTIVGSDDVQGVLVSIKPGPRTQDIRDSFGLAEAWSVLSEGYDFEDESW